MPTAEVVGVYDIPPGITLGGTVSPQDSEILQAARDCIAFCQQAYPSYWRTTIDANGYRNCLSGCSGLPVDRYENWPADLLRNVGQDTQQALTTAAQAVSTPLSLAVIGLLAAAYIVFRLKP